ncbi:hypothetical protein PTTG_25705 [Puccinia triticina 1-1 BBBD Race 1]|uniref:Lysophospholipase n=2 Tax=Puccinia triticina TaxID=208348 RepID=A0A180H0F8_PUCT1|nr:uncharacterized protein PtA15_8A344 [Puccinia triticina]OAV98211.1 hypothetical protein PTTG_25705 [Puccinia triticina 1-1 BBBD Race 1]WAQ87440.1 hypothetical protein PtA15_8A344 [Puccinia triticina]WAR57293.1 hypothetical protein PtB15_8B340 [Puccinia triticina]
MTRAHCLGYLWCLLYLTVVPSKAYNLNRKHLVRRDAAISNSPSGNYAPVVDRCPTDFFTRRPDQAEAPLGKAESDYVNTRAAQSIPLWEEYLGRVGLKDFDVKSFLSKAQSSGGRAGETLPNLAFSLSGGGARALCVAASILEAFDIRNDKAKEDKVGGILQLANYVAGVSGSSWLLGSWATSNFPRVSTLNWRLDEENDLWDWNVAKHFLKVYKIVKKKTQAGFPTSVVDAWAILLNRHFINDPSNKDPKTGQAVLWSSIRQTSGYKERSAPFVMAIATSRPEKKTAFTPETPIYEFTPEEFGVWHPYLNVSIPIDYLGSPPEAYKSPSTSSCVKGFDNAGFVMGLSSNIYSAADDPNINYLPSFIRVLDKVVDDDSWEGKVPNTFQGLGKDGKFQDANRDMLLIADCGLIMENVPLFPFLQPSRKVDVIFAVDSSADGLQPSDPSQYGYPNGTALFTIYSKTLQPDFKGYPMPKIPNPYDGSFSKAGYHERPTFFGCDAGTKTPLIIYLPNYYMVGKTNVPTKETTYSKERLEEFFENGLAIASQNAPGKGDKEWPACLACALIDHQLQRNSQARTKQCQKCFDTYCARV